MPCSFVIFPIQTNFMCGSIENEKISRWSQTFLSGSGLKLTLDLVSWFNNRWKFDCEWKKQLSRKWGSVKVHRLHRETRYCMKGLGQRNTSQTQWVCKWSWLLIYSPLAQHHNYWGSLMRDPIRPSASLLLPATEPLSNSFWQIPELLPDSLEFFLHGSEVYISEHHFFSCCRSPGSTTE